MNDIVDDSNSMCPGLRAVCDSLNTALNAAGIEMAAGGRISYQDVIGEFITAEHFIERGSEVVKGCHDWHRLGALDLH